MAAVAAPPALHPAPAQELPDLFVLSFNFGEVPIKGRSSGGNIVTKLPIDRIVRAPKDYDPEVGA